MKIQSLIEQLSPLEGHKIRITDVDGNEHEQMCSSIEYLPKKQRDTDQGNVILWNGKFTPSGTLAGFTMLAKNALLVDWQTGNERVLICLRPRSQQSIRVIILE